FIHYFLFIDKNTGEITNKTYIASGTTQINLFGNSIRESVSGNVVVTPYGYFYCTNIGIAGTVGFGGEIKWLHKYDKIAEQPTRDIAPAAKPATWLVSDPRLYGELIIFSPLDSRNIFALDSKTGRLKYKIVRADRENDRHFYGVVDQSLVVGGSKISFYDVKTGEFLTYLNVADTGRGVIYGQYLLVPGKSALVIIDCSKRKILNEINLSGIESSNLHFDGTMLIASSTKEVNTYVVKAKNNADKNLKIINTLTEGDPREIISALKELKIDMTSSIRNILDIFIIEQHIRDDKFEDALAVVNGLIKGGESQTIMIKLLELRLKVHLKQNNIGEQVETLTLLLNVVKDDPQKWALFKNELGKILKDGDVKMYYSKQNKEADAIFSLIGNSTTLNELRNKCLEIYKRYPFSTAATKALVKCSAALLNESRYDEAIQTLYIAKSLGGKGYDLTLFGLLADAFKKAGMTDELEELVLSVRKYSVNDNTEATEKAKLIADFGSALQQFAHLTKQSMPAPPAPRVILDVGINPSDKFFLLASAPNNTEIYDTATLTNIAGLKMYATRYHIYRNRLAIIGINALSIHDVEDEMKVLHREDYFGNISFASGIGNILILGFHMQNSGLRFIVYDLESMSLLVKQDLSMSKKESSGSTFLFTCNKFYFAFIADQQLYIYRLGSGKVTETKMQLSESPSELFAPRLYPNLVILTTQSKVVCYNLDENNIEWEVNKRILLTRVHSDEVWITTNDNSMYTIDIISGKRIRHIPLETPVIDFCVKGGNVAAIDSDFNLKMLKESNDWKLICNLPRSASNPIIEIKGDHLVYSFIDMKKIHTRQFQYNFYNMAGKLIQSIPDLAEGTTLLTTYRAGNKIVAITYNKVELSLELYR
ncbi:MAG: hypothetical protein HY606_03890, partial [Planctomycetes bacterium]|nr:hypothetical protein [Planctomycetota bacterium]